MSQIKLNTTFVLDIENIVLTKQTSYIEALVIYATEKQLEFETVGALVKGHKVIESRVFEEGVALRLVESVPTLSL